MIQNQVLPKRFQLGEYCISEVINIGGFSIVYLAYHKDGTKVAIKEFFPKVLHLRSKGVKIDFINMREKSIFEKNLKNFKYEANLIKKVKHPNVIEVIDYFSLNGTAYMVMPFVEGITLSRYISQFRKKFSFINYIKSINNQIEEKEINLIMSDIFLVINALHENNIMHFDIKPGSFFITNNKKVIALDLGSAKFLEDIQKTQEQPCLTPGFAPPEQHKEFFNPSNIGVWTDYYALGATIYVLITDKSPPVSTDIFLGYQQNQLEKKYKNKYSESLLKIISNFMQPSWDERKKIDFKKCIQQLQNT